MGYPEVRDGKAYVESSGAGVTDNSEPPESLAIDIGSHVRIEPFAQVMASVVKDGCILDVYSVVRQGAILGKHCHVGVRCEVSNGEEIGDNAVLYWLDTKQRKRYNNTGLFELEKINQEKHCQVLGQLWQASRKGKA